VCVPGALQHARAAAQTRDSLERLAVPGLQRITSLRSCCAAPRRRVRRGGYASSGTNLF